MALANPGHCSRPVLPASVSFPVPCSVLGLRALGWGPLQNHQESLKHKGLGRIRLMVLAAGWQ